MPNLKHYELFKSARLSTVALFAAASESYSQNNLRCSIAESPAAVGETARAAVTDGFRLRGHLAAVFHDIDDGDSDIGTVIDLTHRLVEWG